MTTENVQTSAKPGPGESVPATGPLTAAQASAQLEQLRADRLAGKVLQDDYLARADHLARVATGEQAAPPSLPPASLEERFAQQFDEAMKPPAELHEYGALPTMSSNGAVAQQLDTAVRTAFVKAGIPQHLAAPLVRAVNDMGRNLASASPKEISQHMAASGNTLRNRWGDQFQGRFDGVVDLVCQMAEADPLIGRVVDELPHLIFGNQAAMEYLGRVADHRAGKR